jgi:hypothetical protein
MMKTTYKSFSVREKTKTDDLQYEWLIFVERIWLMFKRLLVVPSFLGKTPFHYGKSPFPLILEPSMR